MHGLAHIILFVCPHPSLRYFKRLGKFIQQFTWSTPAKEITLSNNTFIGRFFLICEETRFWPRTPSAINNLLLLLSIPSRANHGSAGSVLYQVKMHVGMAVSVARRFTSSDALQLQDIPSSVCLLGVGWGGGGGIHLHDLLGKTSMTLFDF